VAIAAAEFAWLTGLISRAAAQLGRLAQALVGEGRVAMAARDPGKALEHVMAEKGEPDAVWCRHAAQAAQSPA